jgi:glycosyltransferase involved in cell wall biosynthesis
VQYPDDEESLAAALDELLDNPDFLDAVADELMYQVGRQQHSTGQQQGSYLVTGLRPHG